MSIRCLIGLHRWVPYVVPLPKPHNVARLLDFPLGVMRVSDDGLWWVIDAGHRCANCGKRRPA